MVTGENIEKSKSDIESNNLHQISEHRFVIMIAGAIATALVLVIVSIKVYNLSGAAQLDLSLPSYNSKERENAAIKEPDTFSSTGPIEKDTLDQFLKQYDKQLKQIDGVDGYNTDGLSDSSLGITGYTGN